MPDRRARSGARSASVEPFGHPRLVVLDAAHAHHALMGENPTGAPVAAVRLVNESLPADRLETRVRAVANALLAKNRATLKATERTIRAVRLMEHDQALDHQVRAREALMYIDATRGREAAMRQFLDEKSYRPGLGAYDKDRPGAG